jgi:hypothetical protein
VVQSTDLSPRSRCLTSKSVTIFATIVLAQVTHLTSWRIAYNQWKRLVTAENISQMGLLTMFVQIKNKLQYRCPTWNALKDHEKGKSSNEYTYTCLMGTGKWSLTRQGLWIEWGVYINWKHFWMLIPGRKHLMQSSHWTAMYASRIGQLLAIVFWHLCAVMGSWLELLCGRSSGSSVPAARFPLIKTHVAMTIAEL